MINEIFVVSEKVGPRNIANVGLKLMEEAGELAKEANILDGYIDKPEGEDGVLGEAADVIICAIDMVRLAYGNSVTPAMLHEKVKEKLIKWEKLQGVYDALAQDIEVEE